MKPVCNTITALTTVSQAYNDECAHHTLTSIASSGGRRFKSTKFANGELFSKPLWLSDTQLKIGKPVTYEEICSIWAYNYFHW